jgi:hypothetical protein
MSKSFGSPLATSPMAWSQASATLFIGGSRLRRDGS